jgi:hypothetical protein
MDVSTYSIEEWRTLNVPNLDDDDDDNKHLVLLLVGWG